MERNANYALVGLASAILLVGLVVFLVLLAGRKFSHDYDVYDIVFQGPVRGLAKGGEVDFNGPRGRAAEQSAERAGEIRTDQQQRPTAGAQAGGMAD